MSEQIIARSARFIPPLPEGIGILPGQVRARRRLPRGHILLLVLAGLGALIWFALWHSDYDGNRIDPVVTQAMFAHAPKGTRIPVTLWGGPRILRIEYAFVQYESRPNGALGGGGPTTCVSVSVLDPMTGAKDPKYAGGAFTCIEGLAYRIR